MKLNTNTTDANNDSSNDKRSSISKSVPSRVCEAKAARPKLESRSREKKTTNKNNEPEAVKPKVASQVRSRSLSSQAEAMKSKLRWLIRADESQMLKMKPQC